MEDLLARAEALAALLTARGATVAVCESSTGGLVSAALLAVPGASAYCLGGGVVYTAAARTALLGIADAEMAGIRPASEPYARLLARTVRARLGATWGIPETGAAGPGGNRYGDPAGHACLAVAGPEDAGVETVVTLATGRAERLANMRTFAGALLDLFAEVLRSSPAERG